MLHLIAACSLWVLAIAMFLALAGAALSIVMTVAPVVAAAVIAIAVLACAFLGVAKASSRKLS